MTIGGIDYPFSITNTAGILKIKFKKSTLILGDSVLIS